MELIMVFKKFDAKFHKTIATIISQFSTLNFV